MILSTFIIRKPTDGKEEERSDLFHFLFSARVRPAGKWQRTYWQSVTFSFFFSSLISHCPFSNLFLAFASGHHLSAHKSSPSIRRLVILHC
jgi:hypothetical protein